MNISKEKPEDELIILKPLNKRPMITQNHFDHIDRLDSKQNRNSSKRNSVSSMRSRNRGHKVRKRETRQDTCVSNLKTILQCYNVFILILGCGVLGVGVWLLVKEYNTREMSSLIDTNLLEMVTYGLIAGGGAATVLAFCGCCGTMKQEKFVLGFYGVVLTLVLITLCVGFGVSFLFRDQITGKIKDRFKSTIINQYGVDITKNSTNRLITDAWDSMQQALGCCGAYGDIDSPFAWGIYKMHSRWHKLYKPNGNDYVPDSCCVDGKSKVLCQGDNNKYDGPPVYGPPISEYHKERTNEALYTEGCYDKVIVYLEQHAVIITVVTGSVPLLLLIGIVIAFYLCAKAKDCDDDDDDDFEVEV